MTLWLMSLCGLMFQADAPRANLIAIVTDDQSAWSVGCYGNSESKTPTMDRLAREGTRFTQAFVATPVCSPSRVCYLTGRYGTELGITDYISNDEFRRGVGIPPGVVTWPMVLQKHGYSTALIGKWHLGGQAHQHPTRNGFSYFVGEPKGSFEPLNPTFEIAGEPKKLEGYASEIVADQAIEWLTRHRAEPFALCIHFREPHTPYTPMPPIDVEPFKSLDPTIPDEPGIDVKQIKDWTREYYACIHAIDRNVERVLTELEGLGLSDRTVVMFTSDHGYNIGHHQIHTKGNGWWVGGGVRGPKRPNMFDRSLRVPLILRGPGVPRGKTIDHVVSNVDMFASVLGLLGVPRPEGIQRGLDFSPLLAGKSPVWRDALFGQYDLHNGGLAYMRMIRTSDWKLVRHYRSEGLDELYNIKEDPEERKNRFENPSTLSIRTELRARLEEWMRSIDDPLLR